MNIVLASYMQRSSHRFIDITSHVSLVVVSHVLFSCVCVCARMSQCVTIENYSHPVTAPNLEVCSEACHIIVPVFWWYFISSYIYYFGTVFFTCSIRTTILTIGGSYKLIQCINVVHHSMSSCIHRDRPHWRHECTKGPTII